MELELKNSKQKLEKLEEFVASGDPCSDFKSHADLEKNLKKTKETFDVAEKIFNDRQEKLAKFPEEIEKMRQEFQEVQAKLKAAELRLKEAQARVDQMKQLIQNSDQQKMNLFDSEENWNQNEDFQDQNDYFRGQNEDFRDQNGRHQRLSTRKSGNVNYQHWDRFFSVK